MDQESQSNNPELEQRELSPPQWREFLVKRMAWAVSMYPMHLRPTEETQANFAIEWQEIAIGIGPHRFSEILREAVRNCKFFPTIAEIREVAGLHRSRQEESESNAAWLFLQDYFRKWPGHPDIGRGRSAPELPLRIVHAARLAGGLDAIEYAPADRLPFVKRDFIAAWKSFPQSAAAYNEMQLGSGANHLLRS